MIFKKSNQKAKDENEREDLQEDGVCDTQTHRHTYAINKQA